MNVELPPGYHLNPSAPQRYRISVENGTQSIVIDAANATRSAAGLQLPIRVPMRAANDGAAELKASFSFVYCREDNTGTCRIKTLVWRAPVEVVNDPAASAEIKVSARIGGE